MRMCVEYRQNTFSFFLGIHKKIFKFCSLNKLYIREFLGIKFSLQFLSSGKLYTYPCTHSQLKKKTKGGCRHFFLSVFFLCHIIVLLCLNTYLIYSIFLLSGFDNIIPTYFFFSS